MTLHDLKVENFPTLEDALAAADSYIEFQRTNQVPSEEWQKHPDEIIGNRLTDRFWYCKHVGIQDDLIGYGKNIGWDGGEIILVGL